MSEPWNPGTKAYFVIDSLGSIVDTFHADGYEYARDIFWQWLARQPSNLKFRLYFAQEVSHM